MANKSSNKEKEACKGSTQSCSSKMREETASEIAAPVSTQGANYKEETASEIGAAAPFRVSLRKDDHSPQQGAKSPMASRKQQEETAAEIAAPVPVVRNSQQGQNTNATGGAAVTGGTGLGTVAIALSILSLFVLPILFGAAGIVLGFVARRRGAEGLGAWAIGIGAVSIIIGIFILPFF